MPYITHDGARLYYEEAGSGRPLIFTHGASQDTLSWRDNIDHFAKRYKVYAIDLPGHGKSDLVQNRPIRSTDDFAAAISRFMKSLDIRRPILVGHSMGAAVSITASLNYRGNILADSEINPGDWMETSILSVLGKTTPMARRKQMAFDCSRCSPYVQYSDMITYTSFAFGARMHEVKVPVYYIIGEDDWSTTPAICRETSAKLKARGVASDVWELKGVGHIPHWEQPETFNKVLEEVLAKFDADK